MSITTIQKWGNSYAVRLPKEVLLRLNLRAGHPVEIHETARGKELSIVPVQKRNASLAEMVAGITEKNLHRAADWSNAVGKEVW